MPVIATLVVIIVSAGCSSSPVVPSLQVQPISSNAMGLVIAYGVSLPSVIWPGGWRVETSLPPLTHTESQAASFTLGRPTDTEPLDKAGFISYVGIQLSIVPAIHGQEGNGGLGILQFASRNGALEFYRYWQRTTGLPISGVPVGNYGGTNESSSCPGQCGDGGFVLAVRTFVIDGGINCQFSTGCAQLAEEVGQAIYRSLSTST